MSEQTYLRQVLEDSMQDIGLGTDERLDRAGSRILLFVLTKIDDVKLSEESLLPGNSEWHDGFRQGWQAAREAVRRLLP